MPYIGRTPTNAALTASDLADGIVGTAKIAADAVTDAKIADDVVGTEHLTAGEVDATALGADSVTAVKINNDIISGVTALAAEPADTDEFLVSDAGTLKRIDYSLIKGGVAGISSSADATAITITDAELVQIKNANNTGGLLSVSAGDSGATANGNATTLVVESNTVSGISILSATNNTGGVYFGDSGDNDIGQIQYNHGTNDLEFVAGAGVRLTMEGTGPLSTGGETAGDVDAGGLTLNHGANDGKFITFKSSDYGHGVTDWAETDTGFYMGESQAGGGATMVAINDGQNESIFNFISIMGETNTTATNTTASGNFMFGVYRKADSGTGTQAVADAGNAWVMRNNNAARLIFKGDGEIHSDTGSTTYDAYEDAQLVRAFDLSHGVGVINSKFDKFISYNHEKLADLGLVGRDEDGTPNHFTNITGMQKLHNGAIWQQYEKHNRLLEAVYELASESVGKEKADAILDKHDIKLLN